MPTISVMVKNFNAQYQDQNLGVRLSGAGCGLLGIVCNYLGGGDPVGRVVPVGGFDPPTRSNSVGGSWSSPSTNLAKKIRA